IIDDEAASDDTKKATLKLSKPQHVKLNIFSVTDAVARKNKIKNIQDKTAIIFGNTKNCLAFLQEFDGDMKEVNYEVIPKKENSKEFDKAIYLNQAEVQDSKQLKELGYRLYSQQTPTTKLIELNKLL